MGSWIALESWRPAVMGNGVQWWITNGRYILETPKRKIIHFASREAALKAANKKNRVDGLPEVE